MDHNVNTYGIACCLHFKLYYSHYREFAGGLSPIRKCHVNLQIAILSGERL